MTRAAAAIIKPRTDGWLHDAVSARSSVMTDFGQVQRLQSTLLDRLSNSLDCDTAAC